MVHRWEGCSSGILFNFYIEEKLEVCWKKTEKSHLVLKNACTEALTEHLTWGYQKENQEDDLSNKYIIVDKTPSAKCLFNLAEEGGMRAASWILKLHYFENRNQAPVFQDLLEKFPEEVVEPHIS